MARDSLVGEVEWQQASAAMHRGRRQEGRPDRQRCSLDPAPGAGKDRTAAFGLAPSGRYAACPFLPRLPDRQGRGERRPEVRREADRCTAERNGCGSAAALADVRPEPDGSARVLQPSEHRRSPA